MLLLLRMSLYVLALFIPFPPLPPLPYPFPLPALSSAVTCLHFLLTSVKQTVIQRKWEQLGEWKTIGVVHVHAI